jgi:hypothetical protein
MSVNHLTRFPDLTNWAPIAHIELHEPMVDLELALNYTPVAAEVSPLASGYLCLVPTCMHPSPRGLIGNHTLLLR